MPKTGKLFGVGVGPGDPELLTLKAHKILTRVPVIFVPRKNEESDSFARSIISSYVKLPEQKVIGLVFPMVKAEKELTRLRTSTKDIACKFAEWCSSNWWVLNVDNPTKTGTWVKQFPNEEYEDSILTTSELYEEWEKNNKA